MPDPFSEIQPDDPGLSPRDWHNSDNRRKISRMERNADSVTLRLLSRVGIVLFMIIGVPLFTWLMSEVYTVATDQLTANTAALIANQSVSQQLANNLKNQERALGRMSETQRRMWQLHNEANTRLVRLETYHDLLRNGIE